MVDLGWKLEVFQWSWHKDLEFAEEQVFGYKDILKSLKELLQSEGTNWEKVVEEIDEARKNLDVPQVIG